LRRKKYTPRENGYAYDIMICKSDLISYHIGLVNVRTCPVFLEYLDGRFPTACVKIRGCVTTGTGIPFVTMRKSDIEASLVMIRKLVT